MEEEENDQLFMKMLKWGCKHDMIDLCNECK